MSKRLLPRQNDKAKTKNYIVIPRSGHYDRGGEEILKYDRVHPNAGDGLNPTTGIFTCPVGGTYMFIIHLSTHKDKVVSCHDNLIL